MTMNLCDNTLGILKNFAGINNSILVKEGNQLRTISVAKNILAEAEIDDQYSHHFTTYDDGMSLQVTEEKMSAHYLSLIHI